MWNVNSPTMRGVETMNSKFATLLSKKRRSKEAVLSSIALVVFVICYMNATTGTLDNIRRILCLESDDSASKSSYIHEPQGTKMKASDFRARMAPPAVLRKNDLPSHIDMCQNFMVRRAIAMQGGTVDPVHITEDEAVCTDWAAPFPNLMQIMAGEVINHVSQKYGLTYSHDCQRTANLYTSDGLNWKTVQQEFAPSGLVLDDGSIDEAQIVELCKGCIAEYNAAKHTGKPWFHPHSTRHCIMYPGTSRPLVNDQNELDLAAVEQQRKRAQDAPIGRMMKTVEDRFRFLAAKHKSENGPSFTLATGRSVEDEEEEDGVLIYIDEASMTMPYLQVAKHIPKATKEIDVMVGPLCVDAVWENDVKCIDFAEDLKDKLSESYPDAEVSLDVSVSSAAAVSRMIRAKVLICPPGTATCLVPTLAKEEDTFAILGESMARSNTEEFFDFVSVPKFNLQIANLDDAVETNVETNVESSLSMGRGSFEADQGASAETVLRSHGLGSDLSNADLLSGISAFSSGGTYKDGCVEVRGRMGDWEKDFVYEDLGTEKNGLLRGSSIQDVVSSETHESRGTVKKDSPMDLAMRSFTDGNSDCELDMLNLHGLCEVVNSMKLGVLQFVGDQYTEEMVKSFWALLGIDDGDSGKVSPGSTHPDKFEKTVHCPTEHISFEIVFTPNEQLFDLAEENAQPISLPQQIQYVPVATPVAVHIPVPVPAPTHTNTIHTTNYITRTNPSDPQISTSYDVNMSGGMGGGNMGGYIGGYTGGYTGGYFGGNGGSCWGNPYGNGCCNPNMQADFVPPPPPPPPQYNSACQCIPFQQQYQYYNANASQPRQVIVGAITPNQSYDQYKQAVDNFGRTVTNTVDPNDIVILRTGADVPREAHKPGWMRRTQENAMNQSEIIEANNYLHRSVEEYRRRTKQGNLLHYDPEKSKMPLVHVLDVAHMTHSHPLSDNKKGHRNLENTPNLYDHWNHLLYSNLKDIAKAELARNSPRMRAKKQVAPPGSPYENSVPLFPMN